MSSHNQNPSLKVHGRVPLPPSITRRAPLRACRGQIVLMASAAWYPIAGWVITSTKESEFLANHSKNASLFTETSPHEKWFCHHNNIKLILNKWV
jgi:hypothetical protein